MKESRKVDCLFIDGPGHGRKAVADMKPAFQWYNGGRYIEYQLSNYSHDGKLYRIAFIDAKNAIPASIERLIEEHKPTPIGKAAQ